MRSVVRGKIIFFIPYLTQADFYLLHNLGEARTKFFDDFDMWSFVQEKKKEGLIKHVGFSFHSTPEELEDSRRSSSAITT